MHFAQAFQQDLVIVLQPLFYDKQMRYVGFNLDQPLLQFAFFVDDVDIVFIHNFEYRFLRDQLSVFVRLEH